MRLWSFSILIAILLTVFLSGCGSNVATIADQVSISQSSYDNWLESNLALYQKTGQQLDPPDFTKCAANIKGTDPKSRKINCQNQYLNLEQQVFTQLIQQGWVLAEANQMRLQIDQVKVNRQIPQLRKQYPGLSDDNLRRLAEVNVAQADIQLRQVNEINPSQASLRSFYDKNKKLFTRPATRDVRILVTSSRAKAKEATSALIRGEGWAQVAKKYNNPKLYNGSSYEALSVSKSSFTPQLGDVIFDAPLKKIYGPKEIKDINGWAVVEVIKNTASKPALPFSQNQAQVIAAYRSAEIKKSNSLDANKLSKKWQDKTDCLKKYKNWYPCKGTSPAK